MWIASFIQELQTNSQTQDIEVCSKDGYGLGKSDKQKNEV